VVFFGYLRLCGTLGNACLVSAPPAWERRCAAPRRAHDAGAGAGQNSRWRPIAGLCSP